jgi:hypothetical protein
LLHSDFIAELDRADVAWTVRRIGAALRDGFGYSATVRYNLALMILLLPSLLLAAYAIISRQFGLLIWSLLAIHGFRSSSTRPTGVGVITCVLIAVVGAVIFAVGGDWLQLAGGVMPGVTWFGTCAAKGTAMTYIEQKLRVSPDYLAALVRAGNLCSSAQRRSLH